MTYNVKNYASIDAINFSRLKMMAKSPRHYRAYQRGAADTPSLRLGRAVHALALRQEQEIAVWDGSRRAGADWRKFAETHSDKTILSLAETDQARRIADSLAPTMERFLTHSAVIERPLVWGWGKRRCKGIPDLHDRDVLVDLKTTQSVESRMFGNAAARYHYHAQLAWYQEGIARATGHAPSDVYIVAVETSAPYDTAVFRVTPEQLEAGWDMCQTWLDRLEECERTGDWPGQAPHETDLQLPAWAVGGDVELTIGGERVF